MRSRRRKITDSFIKDRKPTRKKYEKEMKKERSKNV